MYLCRAGSKKKDNWGHLCGNIEVCNKLCQIDKKKKTNNTTSKKQNQKDKLENTHTENKGTVAF